MIAGNKVLAVIPARGGSKGVPRKNLRSAGGKPLIAWTIEEARKSAYIDRLVLSSDDKAIMAVARDWGCEIPFTRPAEIAMDETPGIDPVLHALQMLPGFDIVVLLQPTSPLRISADIDGCIELCAAPDADACVSVSEAAQSPYWMYALDEKGAMMPCLPVREVYARRQDLPKAYVLNGAVYAARTSWLASSRTFLSERTKAFVMPQARSLDIDTEKDLQMLNIHLDEVRNAID
jgi:CMP-N,N'-diacetyllegionaminic acid synthase